MALETRVLELDGSIVRQSRLLRRLGAATFPLRDWGPHIRLGCGTWAFRRFERDLDALAGPESPGRPCLTWYGSGDFHHVSLALVRRLPASCNLLVLDNHPDWMVGVPFLHCGTWLYHAARLSTVQRIFHVGGNVDFDNWYRWMAPWSRIRSGRIVVFPSIRQFRGSGWKGVEQRPLRRSP